VMEIVGLFLVGMVMQRRRLFADAGNHRGAWLLVAVGSGLLWALAAWLPGQLSAPSEAQRQTSEWLWGQAAQVPAMACHVSLFVVAWHSALRPLIAWLAPAGRMTLTLYIAQSVIGAPLFYGYGLGLWDRIDNGVALAGGVVAFALQALFAWLWFTRYRYGPLEWLWRAATLGDRTVPMRLCA
jgi:uncharacterized protein